MEGPGPAPAANPTRAGAIARVSALKGAEASNARLLQQQPTKAVSDSTAMKFKPG